MEKTQSFAEQIERQANELWNTSQKTYEKKKKAALVDKANEMVAQIRKHLEERDGNLF